MPPEASAPRRLQGSGQQAPPAAKWRSLVLRKSRVHELGRGLISATATDAPKPTRIPESTLERGAVKTKKLLKKIRKNPGKGATVLASALAKNPGKVAKQLARDAQKDPKQLATSFSKAAARVIGGKHKKRTRRVIEAALATALAVAGTTAVKKLVDQDQQNTA